MILDEVALLMVSLGLVLHMLTHMIHVWLLRGLFHFQMLIAGFILISSSFKICLIYFWLDNSQVTNVVILFLICFNDVY